MAYSSNILPAFRSWTKSSSSITVGGTIAHFTTSGTYLSYTYNFGKLAQIGNKARITMSSCTGKAYVILYMFDNQAEPSFAYCIEYKNNTAIDIELPSISVIRLYFRVVAREANIDIDGISFNFEQVAEINASTPGSSIETMKPTYATFRSTPLIHGNSVAKMAIGEELTVATLDVALSPTLAQYREERESISTYSDTKCSNKIDVNAAVSFSKVSFTNVDFMVRLYFGDRLLTEKYIYSEDIILYQNNAIDLYALLFVEDTHPVDMLQNISLKLTVSINKLDNNLAAQYITVDFGHSYISASGPLRSLEFYAKDKIDTSLSYSVDFNNLSFMPYYEMASKFPTEIHYTLPIRTNSIETRYCKVSADAYTEAMQITTPVYNVLSVSYSIAKVRKVFITETLNVWNPEICTASSGVELLIILSTTGTLYCCNSSATTLFTIATNVKDFDVTPCGLQGEKLGTVSSIGDTIAPYPALFMDRVIGFTVFYITESAMYVCAYPKVGTSINISSLTLPTASTVDTFQIEMPALPESGAYYSRLRVSALYFVNCCTINSENRNNLAFGLSLEIYKPASSGTSSTAWAYNGYIWLSFTVSSLSGYPARLANNNVSAWVNSDMSTSVGALRRLTQASNVSEGMLPLNKIVSTAGAASPATVSQLYPAYWAHGNIYENIMGNSYRIKRQYFDNALANRSGFSSTALASWAPSIFVNAYFSTRTDQLVLFLLDMLPTCRPASIFLGNSVLPNDTSFDEMYTVKVSLGVMPVVQMYDHSIVNSSGSGTPATYSLKTSPASFVISANFSGASASVDTSTQMIKYIQNGSSFDLSNGTNINSGTIQVRLSNPNSNVRGWRDQYHYYIVSDSTLFHDYAQKTSTERYLFEITTDGTFGQAKNGWQNDLYLYRNDLKYTGWVPILTLTM